MLSKLINERDLMTARKEKRKLYKWIIVGGGIQGCTLFNYLIKHGAISPKDILVIDPHDKPLELWQRCTEATGMEYLRSPSVHHLAPNPFDLEKYARRNHLATELYGTYGRPSLKLFNEHARKELAESHIEEAWLKARVTNISKSEEALFNSNLFWQVHLEDGEIYSSERVVLAIGISEQPNLPVWAVDSIAEHDLGDQYSSPELEEKLSESGIYHLFSRHLPKDTELYEPIAIIGGGISAAQYATKLAQLYTGKVQLITRHDFRVHSFDSDPGWLGPKNMKAFWSTACLKERRKQITLARHRGSMPQEVYHALRQVASNGMLEVTIGEVDELHVGSPHQLILRIADKSIPCHSIVLATGFEQKMPGFSWLHKVISTNKLNIAPCGYPMLKNKQTLEWAPGLHVTGALAELEMGPTSRNIAGAMRGAERILSIYNHQKQQRI